MREHTLEWITKAEEDMTVAEWLQQAPRGMPAPIVFHCQQCIEKYLKAVLVEGQLSVPHSHDLILLANLVTDRVVFDAPLREQIRVITAFAVESRYPGFDVIDSDAQDALQACRSIRQLLRRHLALPDA